MKYKKTIGCFLAVVCSALSAKAQGFQNLDFESASPVSAGNPNDPTQDTFTSALPGWSGLIGGTPATTVEFNNFSLGGPSIDLFGPGWNSVNPGIIDGSYTVFLQSGGIPGPSDDVSLLQSGTIPPTAESLQLKAWSASSVDSAFSVSLNGTALSLIALSSGQTSAGQMFTEYGANIPSYAGASAQLTLTSIATGAPSWTEFDDITFSTQAVPEASPFVLSGIGGLLFALYRRFAPKRE